MLDGSTTGRHVQGSWMQRRGALIPGHENCVGHVVAHGGTSASVQLGGAMRISSSTQMFRVQTQGSRIQRNFQSPGHPEGLGGHWGAPFAAGQIVPGQMADSFRGNLQFAGGMTAPLGFVTLMLQLLQPSALHEATVVPLH